jgi:ABC-2 type transport system permease protein
MTRPLVWSIRRELWENRSIVLAPLIVAGFVLFGTLMSTTGLPKKMRQNAGLAQPFQTAPAPIMLATFLVGFFYSLDALYGERRDRSILFWKSLPVSDRTTVLSKAGIPHVALPLIAFVLSAVVQAVLLFASTVVLLGNGLSPTRLWAELEFFQGLPVMLYGLAVHTLWFAPIYCWLLLLSAWARRAVFLWAVLPPLAVAAVERMAFGTSHFMSLLKYRGAGAMETAFTAKLEQITPASFLSTPGLWAGLLLAAAFLAAAVRLRRNREPL